MKGNPIQPRAGWGFFLQSRDGAFELILLDVGVDLGHYDRRVAHQHLDFLQGYSALYKPTGKGVSESVELDVGKAGEAPGSVPPCEGPPTCSPFVKNLFHQRVKRDVTFAIPLGLEVGGVADADRILVPGEVPEFRQTHACESGAHHQILEPLVGNLLVNAPELLGAQEDWKDALLWGPAVSKGVALDPAPPDSQREGCLERPEFDPKAGFAHRIASHGGVAIDHLGCDGRQRQTSCCLVEQLQIVAIHPLGFL